EPVGSGCVFSRRLIGQALRPTITRAQRALAARPEKEYHRLPKCGSSMLKINRHFITLMIFLLTSVQAQVTTGSIVGTARDASGAVLTGVRVTVTNQRTNAIRTALTDDRGNYEFPALAPSEYAIKAEAKGFKAAVTNDVALPLGAEVRVD